MSEFRVKLSVKFRIKLADMLTNQRHSHARKKMIRVFQEQLSLSEEEQKTVEFKETVKEGGGTSCLWKPEKDPMKEIVVGEIMQEIICKILTDINTTPIDQGGGLDDVEDELYEVFESLINQS